MKKKKVKKNKGFSLKQEYSQSFEYIKESKNFIYTAVLLFFIFAVIGFFFQHIINLIFSLFGINLQDQILAIIQRLIESTKGMSQRELIGFIFFNNLQSGFIGMLFGILLGIYPLFSAVTNGYLLGFVALSSVKVQGFFVLWKVLPHGIFELPAIFISLGLGFRLGMFVFTDKNQSFTYYLLNSLRVFFLVVLPLLIIAAFIEGSLISIVG